MKDSIATLEIRVGRDDLCKQHQAVRGARTGQILTIEKAADV